MIRSLRPHVLALFVLCAGLLGRGAVAAWPSELREQATISTARMGAGGAVGSVSATLTTGWRAEAGAPDPRRFRRRILHRAASRRSGREFAGGSVSALSPGSNPLVLALIQDGGSHTNRVDHAPARHAGREAGPSRAPPALN